MNVGYLGILQIPIKTYPTTYVPNVSGWQFAKNSLQPMEVEGYIKGGAPVAVKGGIMDSVTGFTYYNIGNSAGASNTNNVFGNVIYKDNRLRGVVFGQALDLNISGTDYGIFLDGTTHNFASFDTNSILTIGGPNTGAFAPNMNTSFITDSGYIYSSYIQNLVQHYIQWIGGAGIINQVASDTWNSSRQLYASMPYAALNYCVLEINSLVKGYRFLRTNFTNRFEFIRPTWINPPGNINVDVNMNKDILPTMPTYNGWLTLFKGTGVVDGNTLDGYGVLARPDYGYYQIVQFLPQDATAANWNKLSGDVYGKFDTHGVLWLHQSNVPGTLFISGEPVVKQWPIHPPNVLPEPPPDFEETILPYREIQR